MRVADGELVIPGDVLHHTVQLLDPTAAYRYHDPEQATATRLALLAELRARGGVLATAHLAEPFVTLPTAEGDEPG